MFGHWMQIETERAKVRLGPIKREDMPRYIAEEAGWGMQSYEVAKYLGRVPSALTLEGEYAWWDKISADTEEVLWGIYVLADSTWKLVGSTSLGFQNAHSHLRATSGYLCFDRAYWAQGIASTAHLGRTLFAFEELGLLAIDSHAAVDNIGSNKALKSVGYVQVGTSYGFLRPVHGQRTDTNDYCLVNPAETSWRYFWDRPADQVPAKFMASRKVASTALGKARQAVTFL